MPTWAWIIIAIVLAAAVVGVVAGAVFEQTRRRELRRTFGPEYDRAVAGGNRRNAEAELRGRVRHRQSFETQPIEPELGERYRQAWTVLQTRFVDEPALVVREADTLVREVMARRGYPMDSFEQQAADISVDHPDVVEDYRAAHRIATASATGDANTEDLRQAMVHYRSLFQRLLAADVAAQPQAGSPVTA